MKIDMSVRTVMINYPGFGVVWYSQVFDKLLKSARKSSPKWANRRNEEGKKPAYREEQLCKKSRRWGVPYGASRGARRMRS
jgi:hypothetical protein